MLPEDKVSGLAMQGKPVALSRGATSVQAIMTPTPGLQAYPCLYYRAGIRKHSGLSGPEAEAKRSAMTNVLQSARDKCVN